LNETISVARRRDYPAAMPLDALRPGKREISEEDDVSPDPSDLKKRRAPGTSSRGVANLTPDQLAKKRANDHEAQRLILY
jgi:hypothetical protein